MSSLRVLQHDIAHAIVTYTPAKSERESKQERHARHYLEKMEGEFNNIIHEFNLPKFPFKHVLKDMGIIMNYERPDYFLRQAKNNSNLGKFMEYF